MGIGLGNKGKWIAGVKKDNEVAVRVLYACLIAVMFLLGGVVARADNGVALEVVNKTGKELDVRLSISSFEGERVISRTVAKEGTVRFSKSETMHDEEAMLPRWELSFNSSCKYTIRSNDGQCPVVVGLSSCANYSSMGDACSIRFVVAE